MDSVTQWPPVSPRIEKEKEEQQWWSNVGIYMDLRPRTSAP